MSESADLIAGTATATADLPPDQPVPADTARSDAQASDTLLKEDPDAPGTQRFLPSRKRHLEPDDPFVALLSAFPDANMDAPALQSLVLTETVTATSHATSSSSSRTAVQSSNTPSASEALNPAPSTSRHQERRTSSSFTTFRSAASPSSPRAVEAAADAPRPPAKRERRASPPRSGILPHPAHLPQLDRTPENYWNHLMRHHPWALHINPISELPELSPDTSPVPYHRPSTGTWVQICQIALPPTIPWNTIAPESTTHHGSDAHGARRRFP
ncbi:hypothetical protein ANCCAN_22897 [Ancylostoma caninum]|uniref:Uncharacterized protein n=1 Tax=Ancylostoma caninum TaxID=29170 RepID=A0A368FGF8_ANCCA|nr:hypothetical protein ANCCAN_22897 [Ancylostoma caninum]